MRNTVIFCYVMLTALLVVLGCRFFVSGALNMFHLALLFAGVLFALGWLVGKDVA